MNDKIKLEDVNTVGPSGGLVQSLYIYDCITNGSILSDKYVVVNQISSNNLKGNLTIVDRNTFKKVFNK